MRKIGLLFLTTILLTSSDFNGSDELKIWIEQATIDKAIAFEKSLSKKIEFIEMNVFLSKDIYPYVDLYQMAKPIIVKREQTGLLPIYAEYFYSESDEIVRYVSYDWEREKYGNYFKKQEMWLEESKKINEYNVEYERIKKTGIALFGQPIVQDIQPEMTSSASGRGDYLTRITVWENDKYYSKLNLIFESMTYRIRWYYYWKN